MEKSRELYQEEITALKTFRQKLNTHAVFKEDLDEFSDQYEELIAQAKVITRVSDRLQKKLDNANNRIQDQNDEITEKNEQLGVTVDQLAKAKVGKRASTVLLTIAIGLFITEQIILQPIIEEKISVPYLDLVLLTILFFAAKSFESGLEGYFLRKEKKKIIEQEGKIEEKESDFSGYGKFKK